MLLGSLQDAIGQLAHERLAVGRAFASNDEVGILQRAQRHDVPVMLIAGRIADEQLLLDAGFSRVACINPPDLPLEIAMQPETAKENIRHVMDLPYTCSSVHSNLRASTSS